MKVIVARTAGFCWGVRRAMDAVLEVSARRGGRVQTLGPLIHNPQALDLIARRGVSVAKEPGEVTGGTVVVRAHGIPVQELRGLRAREARGELRVRNATCPEVAKVHGKILKWSPKGYFTVILGTKGHAESVAHESFAASGAAIVQNLEEARALPDACLRKVLVVAQTTFTVADFHAIVEELQRRAGEMVVENTICRDTWTRQEEAHRIAAAVDAVVVVGGRNSANTRHLVELSRGYGKPVQYVETAAELDLAGFRGTETVGVLAGASTPTWLVEEVVDALENLARGRERLARFVKGTLAAPLGLGLGVGLMTAGVHAWAGLPVGLSYPVVAGLYMLGMYLLAPYLDPAGLEAKGPARGRALRRGRGILVGLGSLALAGCLALAARLGWGSFLAVLGASVAGLFYRRSLHLGRRRYSLQAIPGSKDVLVSLALAAVAVAVPLWHDGRAWDGRAWTGVALVAALAFARTSIHAIRDMQNDRILGRETLPIALGRDVARRLILGVLAAVLLAALAWTPWGDLARPWVPACVLPLSLAYPLVHLWLFHERFSVGRELPEPPLELAFYLPALLLLA